MAKKKTEKPTPVPEGTETSIRKSTHLNRFVECMESHSTHRIQCSECCKEETTEGGPEKLFARELYSDGWRWVDVGDSRGVVCPDCVAGIEEASK